MASDATLIQNVRRVDPDSSSSSSENEHAVLFEGGKVLAWLSSGEAEDLKKRQELDCIDGNGHWLLPGWIDLQVNDIEWLAQGFQDAVDHAQRIREVYKYQIEIGVTSIVLATLAAPENEILAYLEGMAHVLHSDGENPLDAMCLGALLEGTFMNPAFHGAHNPEFVFPPNKAQLDTFLQHDSVRFINIAPEMSEDALEVIAYAKSHGLKIGIGHAKPSAERTREAVQAGLEYVIHLGNGPTGSSLKSFGGGGLFEEALYNDGLTATIIADGYHLDPRLVRDIIERKEDQGVVAVSDAGFALGNPAGDFEVFGVQGQVSSNGEYLQVKRKEPPGALAHLSSDFAPLFGSASDMKAIFNCLLNLFTQPMTGIYHREHAQLELEDALKLASKLCSSNPAHLTGKTDRGRLNVSERADAILLNVTGEPGHHSIEIKDVFLCGQRW